MPDDLAAEAAAAPPSSFKRLVVAGIYVGLTVDPKVNPQKVAEGLASSNFNSVSMHLISPWNNTGFYPWAFDSSKNVFDLTQKNQAWYDHAGALFDALMAHGIAPHLSFFDIYQDQQWDQGTNKCFRYKPFRHNTFGQVLTGQQLYDSWSAGPGGSVTFYWNRWDHNPQNPWLPINYKPNGRFGQPIYDWVDGVIALCKPLRLKYPKVPITYKYANECQSTTDGQGHYEHGGKAIGAGPEIQQWFWQRWAKAGFTRTASPWTPDGHLKSFVEFWNMDVMGPGATPDAIADGNAFDDNHILHTMCREIHSMDGPVPIKKNDISPVMVIAQGGDAHRFMFSKDGTGENLPQAATNSKWLYHQPYPIIDIKWLGPDSMQWSMHDMQKNFDGMLPFMKGVAS